MTDEKNKVIQLKDFLGKRPLPEFDGLNENQVNGVINWFWDYLQLELTIGLGLVELSEEEESELDGDLYFFDKIDELFDKSKVGGCYFCDPTVDPNDKPFDPRTARLCMDCTLKLSNFVQALGIDSKKVFRHIRSNPEQPRIYKDLWDKK